MKYLLILGLLLLGSCGFKPGECAHQIDEPIDSYHHYSKLYMDGFHFDYYNKSGEDWRKEGLISSVSNTRWDFYHSKWENNKIECPKTFYIDKSEKETLEVSGKWEEVNNLVKIEVKE